MTSYVKSASAAPTPETDVELLRQEAVPLPQPVDRPCMAVLSGLPGSGKTTFARKLAMRVPLAILESDALRQALVTRPKHSAKESKRLFSAIHTLAYELLLEGISVLVDATNLRESNRAELYALAKRAGARLFLVSVEAPQEVIRERLEQRATHPDPRDASTADWRVYRRMVSTSEPISRPHLTVNTDGDIEWALEQLERHMVSTLQCSEQPTTYLGDAILPAARL